MHSKKVKVELTGDEALVLYDWLTRFNEETDPNLVDQAEARILFDLESILEKALVAPFEADYVTLLGKARSKVCDERV